MKAASSDAARLEQLNCVDGFIRRSTTENQNDTVAAFHTIMGMQNDQISNFIARMEAEFAANATRSDQPQAGAVIHTTTGPAVLAGIVVHAPRRDNAGRLRHSPTGPVSVAENAESSATTSSISGSFNTTTASMTNDSAHSPGKESLSNKQAQLGGSGEKIEEAAEDEVSLGGVTEEMVPGENEAGSVSSAAATVKYAHDNDVVKLNEEQQNETDDSTLSGSAVPPSEDLKNNAGEGGTTNAVNMMEHTEINVGEDAARQAKCCVIL